jgi:hypothetical protein
MNRLKLSLKQMHKLLSLTCAVWGFDCRAAESHLATDHLFGPPKEKHSGVCRLDSNGEVEMAVRECSLMLEARFLPRGTF